MEETFEKYRNIISLKENYKLTESQFKYLVKENIYPCGDYMWSEDEWTRIKIDIENLNTLGFSIFYNDLSYNLNPNIIDIIAKEIYDLLKTRFKYSYRSLKEEIKFELGQFINKQERQNYLNQKHSEIWSSLDYLKDNDLQSEFLNFYEMDDYKYLESEDWLILLWEVSEDNNIFRYLSTNDSIYLCFEDFIDKYLEFGRVKVLSLYCKELLFQIENTPSKTLPQVKTGIPKITPLEFVCYIEILRDKEPSFSNLDYQKKVDYLNFITKSQNFNIGLQLIRLEKIISMDDNLYDRLEQKQTAYATILEGISGINHDNLRKKIRLNNLSFIKKEPSRLSEADKKHNEKAEAAKVEIKKVHRTVLNLIEDIGQPWADLGYPKY